MFRNVAAIGNDLIFRGSVASPTLRVDRNDDRWGMTIAADTNVGENIGPGSNGTEGEQRDLRRAVEPEWETDGAEAAIDVKLQIPEPEPGFDILAAQMAEESGDRRRHPDLAAVGVAGEHKRNCLTLRKPQ